MKVQVLYFAGCPNHESTTRLARDVARELGLGVSVEEVEVRSVEDAVRLRFLGSPSVHVNDVDIEPGARKSTAYAFACRTYGSVGVPPRELLVAALKEAASGAGTLPARPGVLVGVAGLSAVLASACCLGPLLLTVFGISALGASTAFEPLRPIFLGVTAVLLGGAFHLTYARTSACPAGSVCASPERKLARLNRSLLWVAALAVGTVAVFPSFAGPLLGGSQASVATRSSATVALHIDGMSCPVCVAEIKDALAAVPGVARATVSYADQRAEVALDAASPPPTAVLVEAIEKAGYRAKVEGNQ